MTKRVLPTPVMGDEVYLAAILEELVGLRADMDSARAPEAGTTGPIEIRGDLTKEEIRGVAMKETDAIRDIAESLPKSKRQRKRR